MWKEKVLAYFKALPRNLPAEAEQLNGNLSLDIPWPGVDSN
jgi:hypothetical protein